MCRSVFLHSAHCLGRGGGEEGWDSICGPHSLYTNIIALSDAVPTSYANLSTELNLDFY